MAEGPGGTDFGRDPAERDVGGPQPGGGIGDDGSEIGSSSGWVDAVVSFFAGLGGHVPHTELGLPPPTTYHQWNANELGLGGVADMSPVVDWVSNLFAPDPADLSGFFTGSGASPETGGSWDADCGYGACPHPRMGWRSTL